uniref:RNA-directed RNA polymerase n=1 Tax=Carrot mottle virus TaxID=68033 RepID=A0A3G9K8R6_9TOMB|nr:RNA-dependent RNA polymerase [Carrot mottle virus]
MSFLKRILKHLDSQFSPAPGVYNRDVCAERYGAEWGVLITQERMTRALSVEHERWYTGRVETDVYIPVAQYVDPRDVEAEPTSQQGNSTGVDNPVNNCSGTVPAKPATEVIPVGGLGGRGVGVVPAPEGPIPCEGNVYAILRMADPTADASESSDDEEDTCCPAYIHAASNSVAEHSASAVPPPMEGTHPGASPVGVPPSLSAVGVSPAVNGTHVNTVDASTVMPTKVEGPDEGVSTSPLQEAGPSMAFVDASSVAMELRARFGYRTKNPANLELGGRVARDILKGCGAVRSENYYLAQLAVQLWFAPTLLDLVLRGPVQDFLLGGVLVREGVCTNVIPKVLSPSLTIRLADRPRPVSRVSYQIDAVRPLADYGVHNNSLKNLVRGINERVLFIDNVGTKPVQPSGHGFSSIRDDIKAFRVIPWTMEQVVASYSGSQQTRYNTAMQSIYEKPFNRDDARVSTFIKAEKINFTAKPDPAPRVIQPRDPRFNICFAKFIKPLEPMLYKALGRLYKHPCIAKGFNAFQTGDIIAKKWRSFRDPVCVGLDASRFDQHVSVAALKFTHKVYKRFVRDPEFDRLLQLMYTNKGRGTAKDGVVKYKVKGCRMSGDMDTALGNCVLMVLMTRELCKRLEIPHELMDNGDDCIVIFDKEHLSKFQKAVKPYFRDLGFSMKVEAPVFKLEQVEFCQTQPVFDGTQWRMVRQVNSIAKDLCSVISWEQLPYWWDAIGTCGLALAGGIPVLHSFYKWLCRIGTRGSNVDKHPLFKCGMVYLSLGMDSASKRITPEGRLSFASAFGISPAMQVALEGIYDKMGSPKGSSVCRVAQGHDFNDWFTPDRRYKELDSGCQDLTSVESTAQVEFPIYGGLYLPHIEA